ncbi:hypothetical protein Sango_1324900 [Sesamum angolense]|uniref:AP-5 complex subunit zeta-1 ARM repeats domain-containing protein n=1 Tax=Sesamum angolense TaxID=2727404 RepID=A0AAE2BUQ2_9LAMI|nr:hypothetical protein Sango_1324900 [Sesamum angolense]
MVDRDKEWEFHLRSLSSTGRDSNYATDPASDPSLLNSVKRLHELCKTEKSEELMARVYPHLNKIFQRCVTSISQSRTSNGLLLLAILQFFIDFGDVVLHDADPSLRTFFRSCLSREFADPVVAEATLEFLTSNKEKLLKSFPTLLPEFFPLMLKLIAWNGEKLENLFLSVFSGLISPGSFIPLFPSLVDLPILVVALEKVERSSGSLVGSSIASIQQSAAPEMLLALMDEAYTGSTIGDGGADSESEDSTPIAVADPLFLDILKDENDGLAERHWTSPAMAAALQAVINAPLSQRLKEALKMAPKLLDSYFTLAVHDANECSKEALRIHACLPSSITSFHFLRDVTLYLLQKQLLTGLEKLMTILQRSKPSKPLCSVNKSLILQQTTLYSCLLSWHYSSVGRLGVWRWWWVSKDAARELFEFWKLLILKI